MSGKETRGEKIKKKVSIKEANTDNEEKNSTTNGSNEKRTSSGSSNTSEPTNIKKEIREMIENFGKSHSEPIFKSEPPPPVKTDTSSYVRQFTFTESLTRTSGETDVCDEMRDCNEDTTLDGKIIEYSGETPDCQSLAEVEPIPEHYTVEEDDCREFPECEGQGYKGVCDDSIPLKVEKVLQHKEMCNIESRTDTEDRTNHVCFCERNSISERGYTDRYNYNHVKVVRHPKDKDNCGLGSLYERIFRKKKKYKHKNINGYRFGRNCINEKESGETIPQLYKAKMRQLPGTVPDIFSFRAVTGTVPYNTGICSCHCMIPERQMQYKNMSKLSKDKCFPAKQFVSRSANNLQNTRACLTFEGNEYISTKELPERIDIYCFDHLNTSYFRTSDQPPPLITDAAMERTEAMATRFWAELFGFFHIFIAFGIAFILQLYKFILYSLIRPIMIGIVQLSSDYFFKPLLTIIYNGFTQPFLVFVFNIAASLRDVCSPIAKGIGYFISEIAVLLRAIRVVDMSRSPPPVILKDFNC